MPDYPEKLWKSPENTYFKPSVYSLRLACLLILMFCCLLHMFLREQTIDVWLRVMSPPRGVHLCDIPKGKLQERQISARKFLKKVGQTLRNTNGHAVH